VIEGFRIEVTADELMRRLDERIERHREISADCDRRRVRLEAVTSPDPDDEDEQLAAAWPGFLEELEHRAERHRDRATALLFLRDHIVANEIYRLGEDDLRFLELLPENVAAVESAAPHPE
jgi:hypothetical protein